MPNLNAIDHDISEVKFCKEKGSLKSSPFVDSDSVLDMLHAALDSSSSPMFSPLAMFLFVGDVLRLAHTIIHPLQSPSCSECSQRFCISAIAHVIIVNLNLPLFVASAILQLWQMVRRVKAVKHLSVSTTAQTHYSTKTRNATAREKEICIT